MQRLPWLDRKFQFDIPPGWVYNIVARLEGTESRLRHVTQAISDGTTQYKPDDKWSIKEHIGHLGDLEDLHIQRLSDFTARRVQLSIWDVTNAATEKANHNSSSLEELIDTFSVKRKLFIQKLWALDDDTQMFQSLHPRLKIMMKPVDMATFIAEHDDHHIASMMQAMSSFSLSEFK
jgi:hypothetical protein